MWGRGARAVGTRVTPTADAATAHRHAATPAAERRAVFAAFAGDLYPRADLEPLYAALDDVATAAGGTWRALHVEVGDPRQVAGAARRRYGDGLVAPFDAADNAQAIARFTATVPAAVSALLAELAAVWGCSPAAAAARPEVGQAFAFARWAQSLAPRALVAIGQRLEPLRAVVAARLLDLPCIAVLDGVDLGDPVANLLTVHLRGAAAVVATSASVREELRRRCGDQVDPGTFGEGLAAARAALLDAAATPRRSDATPLGGAAAFGPLAAAAPATSPGPQPFVVLCAERTGSNLLLGMLAARPDFVVAGELFNLREILAGSVAWPDPLTAEHGELLALRARDPAGLLARLHGDAGRAGATHCGFKLMYGHALQDDRIVAAAAADPRCRVVHLLRRDRLQRWRSHARALATDRWIASVPDDAVRIELPVVATAADFAATEALEWRFRAAFARCPRLELDYEDLTRHLPQAAMRLGELFGVDLGDLQPRTRKTGPATAAEGIANLDELRAAFAGTRWSPLFA